MAKTFAALKAAIRLEIFPDGEAENLVVAHDKSFLDAVIDLQKEVECLQVNNTQIIAHCATFFQCGLTVFDAPRGRIRRVSTYDRIDADCNESLVSSINWCRPVHYGKVDYMAMQKYVDTTVRGSCSGYPLFPAQPGCDLLGFPEVFSKYYGKRIGSYPAPTDATVQGFPELALGFKWAQPSTDSIAGRAKRGYWAQQHGRIYIAPWIQSAEVIVIEWDGIKRDWQPTDLIDDDPMLSKAVAAYVRYNHFKYFEVDLSLAAVYEADYNAARADLLMECRKETQNNTGQASHSRASQMTLEQQAVGTIEATPATTTTTTTAALPSAPSDTVALILGGPPYVAIQWTPGDGEGTQEIWRSINGADYELFETADSNATDSADTDSYASGTILCYKVRGQGATGYSNFSTPACVTTS